MAATANHPSSADVIKVLPYLEITKKLTSRPGRLTGTEIAATVKHR